MLEDNIAKVGSDFNGDILNAKNLRQLEDIRIKYLSRNGLVAKLFD